MDFLAQKPLWKFPIVLLGEEAQVKARFRLFGDSAKLDEIYLEAPNRTPR